MDIMQRIVELERRLARVEANRGASLRFGTITESNTVGSARVQLHDGDGMVSYPVRTLHKRTLKDQDQCLPDLGEQVAVLFAGQGMEEGCVLGATYSRKDEAPGQDQPMQFYRFEDGTVISYDRVNHKYFADIKGEADITVEKNVRILAKSDLEAKVQGTTVIEGEKDVTLCSQQTLYLTGRAGIRMRTPALYFDGWQGGACVARIKADIYTEGLVDHLGRKVHSGDTEHAGNLNQTGNQTVGGDIRASGLVQGNPVEGCRH